MKKNYDEHYDKLYNKFIDNELTNEERKKINVLLKTDKNFALGLDAQKFVHNTLLEIPIIRAPFDITSKVMEQILNDISEKYKNNYFFRIIVAVFLILFLITIIIFLQSKNNVQLGTEVVEMINPYIQSFVQQIKIVLQSNFIKPLGSLFSLIIFLILYFTINEHKKFREKIKEF